MNENAIFYINTINFLNCYKIVDFKVSLHQKLIIKLHNSTFKIIDNNIYSKFINLQCIPYENKKIKSNICISKENIKTVNYIKESIYNNSLRKLIDTVELCNSVKSYNIVCEYYLKFYLLENNTKICFNNPKYVIFPIAMKSNLFNNN